MIPISATAVWNILGEHLLEAPSKGQPPPKYNDAVRSKRNIIWGLPVPIDGHPIEKYIWEVGNNTPCWIGAGNPKLWNEPTWQSGELKKVLQSTEEFIKENEKQLDGRDRFWVANLQLTPVLGQSISTFISEGGSIRPKDLALGGGLGTHGSFKGSNKELRESGKLDSPLWKKTASCMIYDFCDIQTTGDIVKMNIGGTFSGGVGGGGGGVSSQTGPGASEHDEPGGGKRGGRGGKHEDDEGPGGRGQQHEDDDGPGGGGGHHGRGGGHHEGGRRGRGGHD